MDYVKSLDDVCRLDPGVIGINFRSWTRVNYVMSLDDVKFAAWTRA